MRCTSAGPAMLFLRADKAEAYPGIRGAAPRSRPRRGGQRAACGQRVAAGRRARCAMADQPCPSWALPGSRGMLQPSLSGRRGACVRRAQRSQMSHRTISIHLHTPGGRCHASANSTVRLAAKLTRHRSRQCTGHGSPAGPSAGRAGGRSTWLGELGGIQCTSNTGKVANE